MRVNSQLKSQFYPQNKTAVLASLEGEAEKDSEGYNGGNGLVLLGTCSDGDGAEALWRDHPDNSEGNFQAVSSPHSGTAPGPPRGEPCSATQAHSGAARRGRCHTQPPSPPPSGTLWARNSGPPLSTQQEVALPLRQDSWPPSRGPSLNFTRLGAGTPKAYPPSRQDVPGGWVGATLAEARVNNIFL